MAQWLRQSTAATIVLGPMVDSTDGFTPETALTISQADIRLSKNGGAFAQTNNSAGATHMENGNYSVPLDTTDTNTLGRLRVSVYESGALPVWMEFMVVPANEYDSLILGTDALDVEVASMAANTLTATAIAANAITDAKVAADVTIASVTGSVGSVTGAVGSVTGAVGSVTGNVGGNVVGSVGSVTGAVGSVTGNVGGNVTGSVGSVATGGISAASFAAGAVDAAAVAADAVAEIQSGLATSAALATVAGYIDTEITTLQATADAIEADTQDLQAQVGTAGAGLTALGDTRIANLDATVSSRLATAGYTTPPTAAENADGLLGRTISGGANGGRTVTSTLRKIRNRVAIAAGTMTVYQEDDTTADHTAAVTTAAGNPISEVDPT